MPLNKETNQPTNQLTATFNTNQRLADRASIILKKGWFNVFEILEICGYTNWNIKYWKLKHNRTLYNSININTGREDCKWKEDYTTISQKLKLDKRQGRDRIKIYPIGQHHWTKWTYLYRSKIR